jgi:hypothetical protein
MSITTAGDIMTTILALGVDMVREETAEEAVVAEVTEVVTEVVMETEEVTEAEAVMVEVEVVVGIKDTMNHGYI